MDKIQLPVIKVDLPSNGIGYEDSGIPTTVTLRMLTVAEAKIMMQGGKDFNSIITKTVKNCIEEEVDLSKMYVSDLLFLFFMLRKHSISENYIYRYKCKECELEQEVTKVIPDDFNVKELDSESKLDFETELPVTKLKVTLKRLRVEDEDKLFKLNQRHPDESLENRITAHIKEIGGESEYPVIKRIVTQLPLKDMLTIQQVISDNEFGLQTQSSHSCNACGTDNEVMLSLNENFFRID